MQTSRQLSYMMILSLALSGASVASAQSLEEEQAGAEGAGDLGNPEGEEPRLGDEQADAEDETPADAPIDSTSPRELPNTDYFFLGVSGRGVIIPAFIQQVAVDGPGIDGFNPGAGLTFNWRRNNFNLIADVWWNNAVGDGFFRGANEDVFETEYVDVDLFVIFVNAAFLWSFPVDPNNIFAFELGFDLGFGFVGGDLVRTEAYDRGDGEFEACNGPGSPNPSYCEPVAAPDPCYANDGGHYDCREPNWFTDGGDTPFIMPWIALPHLAIRIKPIRQVQIRVDGGYGIYNFFFGGSVSYGF